MVHLHDLWFARFCDNQNSRCQCKTFEYYWQSKIVCWSWLVNRAPDFFCVWTTDSSSRSHMQLSRSTGLVYQAKNNFVKLADGSNVPVICHYRNQQLLNSSDSKNVQFPKRFGWVLSNNQSPRQMNFSLFSQAFITVLTERGGRILVDPECFYRERMECIAAREIQEIKSNVLIHMLVGDCLRKEELIFKHYVVTISEREAGLMLPTN